MAHPLSHARTSVAVVVAIQNEARTIEGKLRELDRLDHPLDQLQLVLVDGGSSDGTIEHLTAFARNRPHAEVVLTRLADKIGQLNAGLARITAPWILVTDADARIPRGTLTRLLAATETSPDVAVVGTPTRPYGAHPLDTWHWRLSNWIRRAESRTGTTGLVIATCYLVRRDLLDRFPDDVTADDVYVACAAAAAGCRVAVVDSDVREVRAAATVTGWFRQKVRRTVAYLHEVRRFLPRVATMPPRPRAVFLWRSLALTVGPVAGLGALAGLISAGPTLPILLGCATLAAGLVRVVPSRAPGLVHAMLVVALPVWILAIAVSALACYPFARRSASYSRAALGVVEPEAS